MAKKIYGSGIENITGIHRAIGDPLMSIMQSPVKQGKMSLNTLIKKVKATDPNMSTSKKRLITSTLKRLNDNPENALITRKARKETMAALADTGLEQTKYKKNHTKAFQHIEAAAKAQGMRDAQEGTDDTPVSERVEKETGQKLKRRMWARARSERREARESSMATRSIGREHLKQAAVSMGEVEQRARDAARSANTSQNQKKDEKPFVDLMID